MSAADNADDAPFGTSGTGQTTEPGDSGNDGIAVHGVFNVIAWNENIAIDVGKRDVGDHEAVTILMENEAAFDFVPGNGFVLREFFNRLPRSGGLLRGRLLRARSLAKKKAAVGKFFDEAALFELGKHLKEGGAAGPSDFEGAAEVFQRGGSVSKL
jgi:hypothetical protein